MDAWANTDHFEGVLRFGGGTTVRALTDAPLKEIRVAELEPAVVEAVAAVRGGEISVLKNPNHTAECLY